MMAKSTKTKIKETVNNAPDLSVVTITYNEREGIPEFIEVINDIFQKNNIKGEIIVVDDNSPDGTAQVVMELKKRYPHTTLLQRPTKMGVGSAYRDGINIATGKIIIPLDADLSHTPDVIPELYQIANEGKIGWGSRYLGDTPFETDFPHKVGTFLLNRWVRLVLQTGVRDNSMGYFAMKKELLQQILNYGKEKDLDPFKHILYGITIAALAKKLKIPIVEVKTYYHRRKHGETKIPFWHGLKTVVGDMVYAFTIRRRLRQ